MIYANICAFFYTFCVFFYTHANTNTLHARLRLAVAMRGATPAAPPMGRGGRRTKK